MKNIKKILAPTDFSESSKEGLGYAISLAEKSKSELIILHVAGPMEQWGSWPGDVPFYHGNVPLWPLDRVVQEAALDLNRFLDGHTRQLRKVPSVKRRIELGRTSRAIVEVAKEERVDLITMTHRRHSLVMRFLRANVAEEVTRSAPCPILWTCIHKERHQAAGGTRIVSSTPPLPMDVRVWLY